MGKSAIQTIHQSFVHFLYLQKSSIAIWLQFINLCMILWLEYIETKHLMYVKISLFENKTLNITIHHMDQSKNTRNFSYFSFSSSLLVLKFVELVHSLTLLYDDEMKSFQYLSL
jgi:hypothetical protein